MNKILQIVLGMLLIFVLAYLSFLEVSNKIEDDLLNKSETKFADKGIVGVTAKLEGEGLSLTRTIILTGKVISEKEKVRISSLIGSIEGVGSVKNQLVVESPHYTISVPTPIRPIVVKSVKSIKVVQDKPKIIKKVEVSSSDVVKVSEKKEVIAVTLKETIPKEKKLETPSVPKVTTVVPSVTQSTVSVPVPIQVTTVPVVIETEEETKNINSKGEK